MKRIRRILGIFVMVGVVLGSVKFCFAKEYEVRNYNVTNERSFKLDVAHVYEISGVVDVRLGKYEFGGTAKKAPIYTNHFFMGKSSYEYRIESYSKADFTVNVYRRDNSKFSYVSSFKIKGDTNQGGVISGLKANHEYFLEFTAPCKFYGYVK